jgi:hypothetical protein
MLTVGEESITCSGQPSQGQLYPNYAKMK